MKRMYDRWTKKAECRDENGEIAVIYNAVTKVTRCISIGKNNMYAFNREVDKLPIGGSIMVEI